MAIYSMSLYSVFPADRLNIATCTLTVRKLDLLLFHQSCSKRYCFANLCSCFEISGIWSKDHDLWNCKHLSICALPNLFIHPIQTDIWRRSILYSFANHKLRYEVNRQHVSSIYDSSFLNSFS